MPGFVAAVKSTLGLSPMVTVSLVSGDTVVAIPTHSVNPELSSSASVTIATVNAAHRIRPGRILTMIGAAGTSTIKFTNEDGATSKGGLDLGGSDFDMSATDVLSLRQGSDGAWRRLFQTNN